MRKKGEWEGGVERIRGENGEWRENKGGEGVREWENNGVSGWVGEGDMGVG